MGRLLAHRDARTYLAGQLLSVLGDSALWLAMGIWVKERTGSNSAAGLVFFAFIGGTCLAPLTGWLVDRVRRRPLLITVNLATGALVGLLLLAGPRLWLVYPVMFGYGVSNSLLGSAQTALLPALLPADLLGAANAALQLAATGLRVVTPLLGAGLLAWAGPRPVILLDAATFGLAAGSVAALRLRERRPGRTGERPLAAITAGLRHIAVTPPLRRLVAAVVIGATVFGFFETVQFAVVGAGLHRSPAFLGVLTAAQGGGALAGGLAAAPLMARTSERALAGGGLLACALACLAELTGQLAVVLAGGALLGVCIVWINVGAVTLLQRRTPGRLLGRVDAAANVLVTVPQAGSIAVGAAVIAVLDYRILLAVMAAVMLAAAGYLARVPASPADTATGDPIAASNRVQR
ncbi:MAG TPA: MFS transporter [Streptosporangiaceae bacterium]|nr:MFS transporter [Streptosporangiaceae bacterium]